MERSNESKDGKLKNRLASIAAAGLAGVALAVLFQGREAASEGKSATDHPAITCEGEQSVSINTTNGNAADDTISGVMDSSIERPRNMTYVDILQATRVYVDMSQTSDGVHQVVFPSSATKVPRSERSGDLVVMPQTCNWTADLRAK